MHIFSGHQEISSSSMEDKTPVVSVAEMSPTLSSTSPSPPLQTPVSSPTATIHHQPLRSDQLSREFKMKLDAIANQQLAMQYDPQSRMMHWVDDQKVPHQYSSIYQQNFQESAKYLHQIQHQQIHYGIQSSFSGHQQYQVPHPSINSSNENVYNPVPSTSNQGCVERFHLLSSSYNVPNEELFSSMNPYLMTQQQFHNHVPNKPDCTPDNPPRWRPEPTVGETASSALHGSQYFPVHHHQQTQQLTQLPIQGHQQRDEQKTNNDNSVKQEMPSFEETEQMQENYLWTSTNQEEFEHPDDMLSPGEQFSSDLTEL